MKPIFIWLALLVVAIILNSIRPTTSEDPRFESDARDGHIVLDDLFLRGTDGTKGKERLVENGVSTCLRTRATLIYAEASGTAFCDTPGAAAACTRIGVVFIRLIEITNRGTPPAFLRNPHLRSWPQRNQWYSPGQ